MFEIIYAKSVLKDFRRIAPFNLPKIKKGVEELINFPKLITVNGGYSLREVIWNPETDYEN